MIMPYIICTESTLRMYESAKLISQSETIFKKFKINLPQFESCRVWTNE